MKEQTTDKMTEAIKQTIEESLDKTTDIEIKEIPKIYVTLTNPVEEEVNEMIQLGYTPWQITPIIERVTKNNVIFTDQTKLVFHFLRRAK